MKRIVIVIVAATILAGVSMIAVRAVKERRDFLALQKLLASSYVVKVRACDVEDAWVRPFSVFARTETGDIPIQDVAIQHFTLSTCCRYRDVEPRTIVVRADGYEPRTYQVSDDADIIALLYRMETRTEQTDGAATP